MIFLLDTNTCILYLNGRAPSVRERLQQTPPSLITVCAVVKAELYAGAAKTQDPTRTRARQERFLSAFVSLPFDDAAADIYGDLRATLERAGTPIGAYDLQIAAIALARDCTLVTHNTREFARVPDLSLDDWEEAAQEEAAQEEATDVGMDL